MKFSAQSFSFIVVEDNDFQRTVAVKMLESMGSKVVLSAPEGQKAIEILIEQEEIIDIVISDLDMPGMDGVEFLRHLAEQNLCKAVVVASGMDASLIHTVENLAEQHGLNLLGSIEKPITPKKIEGMIAHFIDKQKFNNPKTYNDFLTLSDIQEALNKKEIKVWYQPKVDMHTGQWVAVEALSRWVCNDAKIIMPNQYIPLLEEANLLNSLTWQQLHTVAADIKDWLLHDHQMSVSINISPTMLEDISFPEKLYEIIRHHNISSKALVLEITETALMSNLTQCLETLARLKLKGFALSIDDFGTGYSNLQQLSRVPFTELKIDQCFVKNIHKQKSHQAIVESNINMAKKMKLKTVAEGVNQWEEWRYLQRKGCHIAQGFLIATPQPKHQLNTWHSEWVKSFTVNKNKNC